MKKLHLMPISLVLVAGAAHAQQPKADKAAPPPQAGGAAAAQAKPAPPAPPPVAPKMEPPKPDQAFVDMAKGMSGTWKCTGTAEIMGNMTDVKATITHKADLNGFWIRSDFTGQAAKLPPMKFVMYTTYDAATKKLWRVQASAMGNHTTAVGTMADKKVTWEGDAHWMQGDVKVRGTDEMVSPKEVHITGEYSKDGGKTWNKDHDATCKK